jgi:hypothetical protein
VPNLQDIRNQSSERSISDTSASSVGAGYSKRQTSAYSWTRHLIGGRNIWIFAPGVSSNAANLRSPPPRNRFRACQSAFHRVPHSKGCHRLGRRHCNTVWLGGRVPSRPACFCWFARRRHPNSKHNAGRDRLRSGCRFRFFLLHKGVQLIQFSVLRLFWYGSRRQFINIGIDPICYGLLANFQNPTDGALAIAFHV